jgi:hypothetical protein
MIAGSSLILSFQYYPSLKNSTGIFRHHKMADAVRDHENDPIDKTPHTLVDAASVDRGADGLSDGKVDIKEEREFVWYYSHPTLTDLTGV